MTFMTRAPNLVYKERCIWGIHLINIDYLLFVGHYVRHMSGCENVWKLVLTLKELQQCIRQHVRMNDEGNPISSPPTQKDV